jgi:hypothetical protein
MMLIYKAWRESRERFLIGTVILTLLCLIITLFPRFVMPMVGHPSIFAEYIWQAVYRGKVRGVFVFLCLFLGLGGLDHERRVGTATFTLSLPLKRRAIIATRAAVGMIEVAALAFVPAVLLPLLTRDAYPFLQATRFAELWVAGGIVFFAVALLCSVLLPGELTAGAVAVMAVYAYSAVVNTDTVRPLHANLHRVMSGQDPPLLGSDYQLHGAATLMLIVATVLVSMVMLTIADQVTSRRDF